MHGASPEMGDGVEDLGRLSPTRSTVRGWRSSGTSVRTRGAHPGKSPGPLARHIAQVRLR